MEKIQIQTDEIQLNQALKLAGILQTGGEIKWLLEQKKITINEMIIFEKRKKLHAGDIVCIDGKQSYQICKI